MTKTNAFEVLAKVEELIEGHDRLTGSNGRYRISRVCDDLSIFDWWDEYLSVSQLKDMRKFIKEAIKLGYTGFVGFKVGASGCANGMWAYKAESTDGYSPDGECLYKSFTPDYNYWSVRTADEKWFPESETDITTIKELEALIDSLKREETARKHAESVYADDAKSTL